MFRFSETQFNNLFPFFILINENMEIEQCGKSLIKLFPDLKENIFERRFRINRPRISDYSFDALQQIKGQIVILESITNSSLKIKGQIEYLEHGNKLLFIGTPWFESIDQVIKNNLVMTDFAFYDPLMDLLHVLKSQEIINEDLNNLLQTIKNQKKQLAKAANEVRDIALFPQQNPDPLIRIDNSGKVLSQNPSAMQMASFVYKDKHFKADEFWKEIAKELVPGQERILLEAFSEGDIYSFVIKHIDDLGYYNIYGRKITEQKKNEEQLMILSSIAAENTHGVVIADKEGRIEWINKSFEIITGYSINEIKGKKPGEILQGPDSDPETIAYLRRQIHLGEPFIAEILNYKKDKTPYWLRIQGQALRDEKGNIAKYFAIEEDITVRIENEKKYHELEKKLRLALERLGDYVWEHDFRTGVTKFSSHFNKFLGIKTDDKMPLDKLWWDSVHEDDKKILKENDRKYKNASIDNHVMEYRMIDSSGKTRWVLDRGVVIEKDQDKNPLLIIGTHTDITSQKELEQEIERQRMFYEQILTNSPVEISVLDDSDTFLYVNPVAHLEDLSRKWMQGKTLSEVYRDPVQESAWSKIITTARKTGKLQSFEKVITDKDGLARYMLYNFYPVPGLKSGTGMVVCYGVDITSVKIALKKAEESEKKYRDIYENSLAIISTHDLQGRFTAINPIVSNLFGYKEEELVGRPVAEFMPKKDQHLFYADYLQRIVRDRQASGINTVIAKNGNKVYTLYNNFLQEEPGKAPYVISFGVDITDRVIAEKQLRLAKKESEELAKIKQNFLANMSHEIRTPMNAIVGMAGQLQKTDLDENQRFYIDTINNATENLLVIINDILDLSKLEAGKMTIESIGFDPRKVFADVIKLLRHKIEEKGLLLKSSFDPDISPVLIGDPVRLGQVFLNIMSNAVKFTEKGSISLNVTVTNDTSDRQTLKINVIDTGIGMDENFVRKLFTKFSQEDRSVSRVFGGTGLGMAITRELLALMGGEIYVESKKNVGTMVSVACEFAKGNEETLEADVSLIKNTAVLDSREILIVDDNEMNRLVASTILKQYNMKIHEAVNGKEALEAIEKLRPEIVLMDIQMPVMDGFDATKVLRNSGNHIPVIAVTANAIKGEYEKCIQAGMNDYLSKPYKEDDLISLIIKWIDLNSLRSVEPQIEKKDKNKTPVTSIEKAEYNLSNLREISRGDQEFVKNMVKLFCEQTPGEVYNMKKAFAEGDLELMGKTAHKIKPSIDNLGIESIGQTIRKLEKFGKENNRDTTIPALLDKVDQTLWRTIQGLKSEFGL